MATIEDLQQLFQLQQETLATEFKDWLDLKANHGKATLAKSAIAVANHGGGNIFMGMGGKPPASKPCPAEIPRYTADYVNAAVNPYTEGHRLGEVAEESEEKVR